MKNTYGLDEKPPLPQALILAVQHILAAFNGIIAVPLIVGTAISLGSTDMTFYISSAIFCAGIVTLMQVLSPLGIGSRLPCIMGTSFTFVGPSIPIAKTFGLGAMLTTTVITSFLETVGAFFVPFIKKLFPRIITSAVVTLIGLSLIPVAVDWSAGGFGSADYASLNNIGTALTVMFLVILLSSISNKFIKTSAVFLGMILGYIICIPLGMVNLAPIAGAPWFSLPMPFRFGFNIQPSTFLPFLVVYLVTTVETIGDLTATAKVSGRDITENELKGGILCDGVGSAIGGVFGGGANTTFSQNIGIIGLTGVASRYVVMLAGILLVIMGICPKLGALIASVPLPVLGGAGIIMFGIIATTGMGVFGEIAPSSRDILIYTLALTSGLAVVFRPDILNCLPPDLKLLLSSGITTGTITAIAMNIILPGRRFQ